MSGEIQIESLLYRYTNRTQGDTDMKIIAEDHCQQCGSTDWQDLNDGDQGYTGCCNERVISRGDCSVQAGCSHS